MAELTINQLNAGTISDSSIVMIGSGTETQRTTWGDLKGNIGAMVSAAREDERITFTNSDGGTSVLLIGDEYKLLQVGEGANGNIFSLDNISGGLITFHPDSANASGIIIPAENDQVHGASFVLHAGQIEDADLVITLNDTNSVFGNLTQNFTLKAGHVIKFRALLPLPSQPKGPNNKLHYIAVSNSLSDGIDYRPEDNNTTYMNATNGFASEFPAAGTFEFPVESITDALARAGTFPSGQHKMIVNDGAESIGGFNNNATGGGNVPNIIYVGTGTEITSFTSIGHFSNIKARKINSAVVSDGDRLEANVIGDLVTDTITFGTTTSIQFCKIKSETLFADIDFTGLNSGARVRIEVDHYLGTETISNLIADIPTGAVVDGWIGSTVINEAP